MITFQKEPLEKFQSFIDEAVLLLKEHYEELAERTDVIELDPDVEKYQKLLEMNILEVHTARDDGNLVGYALWMVMNHLHYKKSVTASSDILYIHPNYRKGIFGYKFVKWTTEEVKKRSPQRILFHMKPHLDYGHLVERLGGHFFEKTYSIVLE